MENITPSQPASIPMGQAVSGAPVSQGNSTRSIIALVLGILSLTCCGFFTGIPAIFLGRSELRLIDEQKIAESNRMIAKIGMILGIVGTVLSVLGTLAYIVMIVLGLLAGMGNM